MSKKKLNILYSSVSGDMLGGGQKSLLLLLEHLDRDRFQPFLTCMTDGDVVTKAHDLNIETTIIPVPPLKKLNFLCVLKFRELIKSKHIDIIHTDHPRHAFYLGLAAMTCRVPRVWHLRVADAQPQIVERLLYAITNRVVAVSNAAAVRFNYADTTKKLRIIYNGIDMETAAPAALGERIREEFGLQNKLVIGAVGQLVPCKGANVLLEAIPLIRKHCTSEIRFLIVGRGDPGYKAMLESKAEQYGIHTDVIFTGYRTDIPAIMCTLDVLVVASDFGEGLSRVILEAMAGGKPVVASRVGGNPEIVDHEHTGFLFPTRDHVALAEAVVRLVNDNATRKVMGELARQRVESMFSLQMNIHKTQEVYQELERPSS